MRNVYASLVGSELRARPLVHNRFYSHSGVHSQNPVTNAEKTREGLPKRRTALVVDDVADVTEMLAVLLSHAGYEVVTAPSAMSALTAVRERQFDVIISDIGMPEMNGYQLAREIRLLPGYQKTPMVALTGYSMFDDKERSAKAGFSAHVTKPIDPRALLDLIEQL